MLIEFIAAETRIETTTKTTSVAAWLYVLITGLW